MIKENKETISCYVGYLQFKEGKSIKIEFIEPKIKEFFRVRDIDNYKEVSENKEISDLDFEKQGMDYFYENIFYDISKNKKGEIEFSVKYCITFDKQNCTEFCDKTKVHYDEIKLNQQPVFYFIYINIEEIFSWLRGNQV